MRAAFARATSTRAAGLAAAAALAFSLARPARAGDPPPPRRPFVSHVVASSSVAREPGRTTWPPGAVVRFTAHLVHPGGGAPVPSRGAWTIDGVPIAQNRDVSAGALAPPFETEESVRWVAASGRHEVAVAWGGDAASVVTDAVSVRVVVSRATLEAGGRRHGSLVRRLRRSLDDLHARLAASRHPLAPRGCLVRFRVDEVAVLDGDAATADAGAHDLALVLDATPREGETPSPRPAVLLHRPDPGGAGDLFGGEGERRLWRALLSTRGVPDASRWAVPAGALPGRLAEAHPAPAEFETFEEGPAGLVVREAAALFANRGDGRARVPDAEAPDGLVRTALPGRVVLALVRGRERLPATEVRWWRPREDPALPEGVPGVAPGRAPDGRATSDARGFATLAGDPFGRGDPGGPARWLLLEVDAPGGTRFLVLPSLDVHRDYARGDVHAAVLRVRVEDLRVPGSPAGGR